MDPTDQPADPVDSFPHEVTFQEFHLVIRDRLAWKGWSRLVDKERVVFVLKRLGWEESAIAERTGLRTADVDVLVDRGDKRLADVYREVSTNAFTAYLRAAPSGERGKALELVTVLTSFLGAATAETTRQPGLWGEESLDDRPLWYDEPLDERLLTVREPTGHKGVPAPAWVKRLVARF